MMFCDFEHLLIFQKVKMQQFTCPHIALSHWQIWKLVKHLHVIKTDKHFLTKTFFLSKHIMENTC